MSHNVHLRGIDGGRGRGGWGREWKSEVRQREREFGRRTREIAHRGWKERREKETEREMGVRGWRLREEKRDRREDWMGRAGSPIYKGEPGDYDLPFVRSFQLFCPIKISIFSPIAATLAGSPFAVSLARSRPPRHPPLSLLPLSAHATLHTVASTVPNPAILPSLISAAPGLLYILPLHRVSSSLSLLLPLPPLWLSRLLPRLSPPTPFRLQYSIIGYASVRGPLAKSGKRSRLRFLRAHKRARVSLPSCDRRLTARPGEEERERKVERG